jgi:hypothetical protein
MSFRYVRDALDKGGPVRVRILVLALITSWFALAVMPPGWRRTIVPLFWVAVHAFSIRNWIEEQFGKKQQAEQQESITLSDSISSR